MERNYWGNQCANFRNHLLSVFRQANKLRTAELYENYIVINLHKKYIGYRDVPVENQHDTITIRNQKNTVAKKVR